MENTSFVILGLIVNFLGMLATAIGLAYKINVENKKNREADLERWNGVSKDVALLEQQVNLDKESNSKVLNDIQMIVKDLQQKFYEMFYNQQFKK